MNSLLILLETVFIVVILGVSMTSNISAEDPDPYETDVAITNIEILDDEIHSSKNEYSILAPTYHDLFVDSENNQVTFNNYVSFFDLRTINNEYHLIIRMIANETIDGQEYFVKEITTCNIYYSPPLNLTSIDTICIDVDIQGGVVHEYQVYSVYTRWRVEDEEESHLDSVSLGQTATVHEMIENPLNQEPTA